MTKPKPVRRKHVAATWDVDRIIAAAGGIDRLREMHAALGFKPLTYGGVLAWKLRESIPTARLAEVLITLKSLPGFDPYKFIRQNP